MEVLRFVKTQDQPRVVVLVMNKSVINTLPSTPVLTESVQQSVAIIVMLKRE